MYDRVVAVVGKDTQNDAGSGDNWAMMWGCGNNLGIIWGCGEKDKLKHNIRHVPTIVVMQCCNAY